MNNVNLRFSTPPTSTNGMAPPWIQSRSGFYSQPDRPSSEPPYSNPSPSFLNITADGFAVPNYLPMPSSGGTGAEIVDVSQPLPFDLPNSTTIYALRTTTDLSNPTSGPVTLHLLSGGLISTRATIQPNVDFAGAEAYINIPDESLTELSGIVTASHGLTKFGNGGLVISNSNSFISGPITILEGLLQLPALPDPTSTDPIRIANGGTLAFSNSTTLSRPIFFTGDSNTSYAGAELSVPSGRALNIAAPINGSGWVGFSGGTIRIGAPVTLQNMLYLNADEINIQSTLTAGTVFFGGPRHLITGSGVIASSSFLLQGGAIAPGDNPGDLGTLTFNSSVELAEGVSVQMDLDPSGLSDHLLVSGDFLVDTLDFDGSYFPCNLDLNFLAPPTGQIYTLISAASFTGTFANVSGIPDGYFLAYTPTSLLLIPTPEPASLLLLAAIPLLIRRSRSPHLSRPWR